MLIKKISHIFYVKISVQYINVGADYYYKLSRWILRQERKNYINIGSRYLSKT